MSKAPIDFRQVEVEELTEHNAHITNVTVLFPTVRLPHSASREQAVSLLSFQPLHNLTAVFIIPFLGLGGLLVQSRFCCKPDAVVEYFQYIMAARPKRLWLIERRPINRNAKIAQRVIPAAQTELYTSHSGRPSILHPGIRSGDSKPVLSESFSPEMPRAMFQLR